MWRVNFPRVLHPETGDEFMALSAYAIPVPGGGAPTHAECHCMAQDGRTERLILSLAYLAGCPVIYLLEDRNPDPTASGLIVDLSR